MTFPTQGASIASATKPGSHKRRIHGAGKLLSLSVIFSGVLAWYSFCVSGMYDPRKLTAELSQQSSSRNSSSRNSSSSNISSSSRTTRWKTALLWWTDPAMSEWTLQEDLVSGLGKWQRLVYLEGNATWIDHHDHSKEGNRRPTPASVPIYPRVVLPGMERGVYEDDDAETGDMVDLTRWYPQIDSADERFHVERNIWPVHEVDPVHCRPMHAWQSTSFPVCNTIHETDMRASLQHEKWQLISRKGFWRHAWRSEDRNGAENATLPIVWKTFKIIHSMEDAFFENSRIDALAMERLTASPSVIAIYGFCSMTVVQEFAGFQLSPIIAKATPSERLDLAVQIARGIRDIHSIGNSSQPSLVHNDVNLANIIVTDDGRPLLNDFNIAVMMMANKTTGQACPYYARYPNPQWRSPEEQVDSEEESKLNPPLVNEKIDMYAMGNVLYRMVAGGSPWKKKGADKLMLDEKILVARLKRYNGTLPGVPESVRHSKDPSTAALYQAMKLCYRFDAQARPSAQELVVFLEAARGRAPTTN